MSDTGIAKKINSLMPALLDELTALVAIPSIAFPEFPAGPVTQMADAVVDLLQRSGAADVRLLDVPGDYPAVFADVPGPAGAPTVLLYAHYDVQPAPPEQGWDSDPWTVVAKDDGRLYGRGVADDKSGIIIHAGTLQAFAGEFPVGIKILVEGNEEAISHLEDFVEGNPALFACDAFVIADVGNQRPGIPALTTALRGEVCCTVAVRTLAHPVHSGQFGGAAPDALMTLIAILATLLDENGDTAVPGLVSYEWPGADMPLDIYTDSSGLLDGVELAGTGTLASRLWSKPSATVIGLDAPATAGAANVLIPEAKATISLRIAPGADADHELDVLMDFLRKSAPSGVHVEVDKVVAGAPFAVDESSPAFAAAREALALAYGRDVQIIGSGGSIPLVASLKKAAPDAGAILWGAQDVERANIHASNESVDPREIEKMIAAQVLTLRALAKTGSADRT